MVNGNSVQERLAPTRLEIDGETYFVAEGDLLLDADQLELYAEQQDAQAALRSAELALDIAPIADVGGRETRGLLGITSAGRMLRWRDGLVLDYCVIRNTFADAAEYQTVVDAMANATAAWERTCGVTFDHQAQFDDSATTQVDEVLFTVRKIDANGRFIAAAFFPNDPPVRRRVLIDPSFYTTSFDRVGVLRHELGHVLGFRHEHIRSGAPAACAVEDLTEVIDLTQYDPQSVMHYFCGGVGSLELRITALDRAGSQRLYGLPLSEFTFAE